jgi:hypothetical protein
MENRLLGNLAHGGCVEVSQFINTGPLGKSPQYIKVGGGQSFAMILFFIFYLF